MTGGSDLFHLFAAVSEGGAALSVRRIKTTQPLQNELTALFKHQAQDFLASDLERIAFDFRYRVDEGEIFTIQPFQLPEDYANAPKHPNEYESISFDANNPPSIKAILAGVHSHSTNKTKLYFQSFSKTQLLLNNFTLLTALHSQGTFHKLNDAGLTLGSRLTAVFQDETLLFRSYTLVNRFLDIKDYFREATDEEVSLMLSHKLFDVEDQDDVVSMSDSWMRKRFSALHASGILDKITPRKTANKAAKYGLTIEVNRKDGKDTIAFPTDKRKAKQLLAFLNEGYFQGELTDKLYQTNSHRSLGASPQPTE